MDVFNEANAQADPTTLYALTLVAERRDAIRCAFGIRIIPDLSIADRCPMPTPFWSEAATRFRTIGEGVEQATERGMLTAMRCALAQGNVFSPQLAAAEFSETAWGLSVPPVGRLRQRQREGRGFGHPRSKLPDCRQAAGSPWCAATDEGCRGAPRARRRRCGRCEMAIAALER